MKNSYLDSLLEQEQTMAEAAAFGKRMFSVVLDGYLSLGLGIGSELGLFKALCEFEEPATASEIAHKAGCKER